MIEVKHDHKLKFPTIEVPKYNESDDEGPNIARQTNIEGVLVPLFRFNNLTITFEMVQSMMLTCNRVPEIHVEIKDFVDLIKIMDTPGPDNILYMQIVPPFDGAYRKIQLAFYVVNSSIDGNIITLDGIYYVPKFFDTVMRPYGMISSYELFDAISNEYSLGFCSNIDDSQDERYIYNPNRTIMEFMDNEVGISGMKEHVFAWWIDFWNNINLVDLFKEYNSVYSDEDMQIWLCNNFKATDAGENEPYQQIAAFSNHPAFVSSPMYIDDYRPVSRSSLITDCNYETYSMGNLKAESMLIQDGDVHNSIFTKYRYGGEVFGDFNYLAQRACREMFINKINSQCIEVITKTPVLGLIKGGHVNVWWYDIGNQTAKNIDSSGIESNIPIPDDPEGSRDGDVPVVINKTISGQYFIVDIEFNYIGGMSWENKYILSRSAEDIQRINPPANESFLS